MLRAEQDVGCAKKSRGAGIMPVPRSLLERPAAWAAGSGGWLRYGRVKLGALPTASMASKSSRFA
jgi:hypothetical protein